MAANTRYAVSAGHTEGEWEIVEYNDGESLTIHALNSDWRICFMATPGSSPNAISRIEANARLIVSACNSYKRQCGDRAIEAAEADLLGRALAALREIRSANPMNINGAIESGTWAKIVAILSQEVK